MPKLENLTNTKICYPPEEIWFICWDNARENIMAYASILPTQCMETIWTEIDYFDNEAEWVDELIDNGINPWPEGPTE
tara:strand:+ start:56 stop:289 length:234 start_codon:yes stop_codon:yes gene_type:complete